jgi:hypothetical protein
MKRMRSAVGGVAIVAVVLAAGNWAVTAPTLSDYFLTSLQELQSLSALLNQEQAWSELEATAQHLTLWRVTSETRAAGPEEGCLPLTTPAGAGEKIRHRFEFASRKGMSSRVFRLDFDNCRRTAEGGYEMHRTRTGFGSSFNLAREPLARGVHPLRVLRLAIADPEVSAALVDALRDRDLAFCQVADDGNGLYRFIVADGVPGQPGTTLVLTFEVAYDGAKGVATFSRAP